MNSSKRAFTLIELMVVVAMIVILTAAMTVSIKAARERACIQKATSEVKVISQAILAYENYVRGGKYELDDINDQDADSNTLGFLLGEKAAESGGKIPVLLMAQLTSSGVMRDPWGMPYKIKVEGKLRTPQMKTASGSMQTGYYLPNFYRLAEDER